MRFTPEADERIDICKNIADEIKLLSGNPEGSWNVYTFKKDKENSNPKRFRVFTTTTQPVIGTKPMKQVMDIFFDETTNVIIVGMKSDIKGIPDKMEKPNPLQECLSDSYRKNNWKVVCHKKTSLLKKLFRR